VVPQFTQAGYFLVQRVRRRQLDLPGGIFSGLIRHMHEPILDAVDCDARPAPAHLRREHRAVVLEIDAEPRQGLSPGFGAEALEGRLHGLGIIPRLLLTLVTEAASP
jgi:hypothetical protein